MMSFLHTLRDKGLIETDTLHAIEAFEAKKPFSLYWELNTLLYLGVLLLNIGLGVLIYQNINTVGHAILVALIGAASAGCLGYCIWRRPAFSWGEQESPTPYYGYILMLGCFTFLIFEGYLQYRYEVFGTRYGLATFIPMVLFFGTAYWFDHRGVLGLAIAALAAWSGISVSLQSFLRDNDFNSPKLIATATLLGAALALGGLLLGWRDLKRHFTNSYQHFAVHLYHIGALSGLFTLDQPWLWIPVLALGVAYYLWYASFTESFYFQLAAIVYAYIGFTYCFFTLWNAWDFIGITGTWLYFLCSGGAIVWWLLQRKSKTI